MPVAGLILLLRPLLGAASAELIACIAVPLLLLGGLVAAAFIAARSDQDVGSYLAALGEPDIKASTIGMLSLVALLQWRLETGALFGLTRWVGGQLGPAISSYHSRSTRRDLERELPRLIRQGDLPELYNFINNIFIIFYI